MRSPTQLGQWFERKYLEYQMEHGLMTLKDFAEILGISRPYLSLILKGERTTLSEEVAQNIARALDDYSLLDLLGYQRPPDSYLPDPIKDRWEAAIKEIAEVFDRTAIYTSEDERALETARKILAEHGIKFEEGS